MKSALWVSAVLVALSACAKGDAGVEEFRWFTGNERYPPRGPTHWSVFDPTGAWLGNVDTPEGFILRHVARDRVLGFVIDELDVKEVYAYALHGRRE
jgi:hypothetical protein